MAKKKKFSDFIFGSDSDQVETVEDEFYNIKITKIINDKVYAEVVE